MIEDNAVKIHAHLDEGKILTDLKGRTRDGVLREMVEHVKLANPGADGDDLLTGLLEREKLGTTAIGDGIAIPHCRLKGVSRPILRLGLSRRGVNFASVDGKPTHVIFLVASPLDQPEINLRILASISKLVRGAGALAPKLLAAPTAGDVLRIIEEEDGNRD